MHRPHSRRSFGTGIQALALALISAFAFSAPVSAQNAKADPSTQPPNTLIWTNGVFLFSGHLNTTPPNAAAPIPGSVDMAYEMYEVKTNRLLVRVSGPASISAQTPRTALLKPPMPPGAPPQVVVMLHSLSLALELNDDRTIRAVRTCWHALPSNQQHCSGATGTLTGNVAVQVAQAAASAHRVANSKLSTGPGNGPSDADAAAAFRISLESQSNSLRQHQQTMMTIIGNMAPSCRPGDYGCR